MLSRRGEKKKKTPFSHHPPGSPPQPPPAGAHAPPTARPAHPGQPSSPAGARRAKGWGSPARLLGGWTGAVGWGRVGPSGATRAERRGERWGGRIHTGLQTLGGVDRPRSTSPPPARRPRDLVRRLRLPSGLFSSISRIAPPQRGQAKTAKDPTTEDIYTTSYGPDPLLSSPSSDLMEPLLPTGLTLENAGEYR